MSAPHASDHAAETMRRLLAKHEPRIRAIIWRRSGPQVLAWTTVDDLFQETAAAAISTAHAFTFAGEGPFLAWITVVVSRVVSRSLRNEERRVLQNPARRGDPPDLDAAQLATDDSGPSTMLTRAERAQAVRDAIAALPKHYRKVLTLYKLEERPLAEVAEALGRTKGATARLIARALQQLRASLKEP